VKFFNKIFVHGPACGPLPPPSPLPQLVSIRILTPESVDRVLRYEAAVKGSLTRDFQLLVSFMNQCTPGP
jgi:hypothetical protein